LKRASEGANSLTQEEESMIATGSMYQECIRSQAQTAGESAAAEATRTLPVMADAATKALSLAGAPTIAGGAAVAAAVDNVDSLNTTHAAVEEPGPMGMKPLKLERRDSM
jgi:hypothetical protein